MADEGFKRKLTVILSADAVEYSRLMGDDEEATVRTLTSYREVMTTLIQQHNGKVLDSPGDNLLAEFVSVVDAVQCAVAVQKEIKARNDELSMNRRMHFRIGINLGDVIEEEGRIYGDGVNIAARLEGLAEAAGICLSGTAFDQVKGKLSLGYQFTGEKTVKNISDPIRAYKVLTEPEYVGKLFGEEKHRKWPKVQIAAVDRMAFSLPDKPSIVVLPFDNMSGDPEEDYFSDGLTEQIITTLSKYPRLFVIARQSAFHYKEKHEKIHKVAEDLGVRHVLKGSVQKSGEKLRITVQLIDAMSGNYTWSERYDRNLKDIFDMQDEISFNVMNAMVAELTEGEQARRWTNRGVTNLKALEKHYQAQGIFCRHTKEDYDKARPLFEEAIALDPNFVMPYVYLGYSHIRSVTMGWSESPTKSIQIASELAQKALAIDDSHDSAHSLLSQIYLINRQYDKALSEAERAIALNPNASDAYVVLASATGNSGRWEESVLNAEKALRLSPFPGAACYFNLGRAYFMIGRYDESIATWKKALQVSPDFLSAQIFLAACYSILGRDEEASAAAKEVLRINPKFTIESHGKRLIYKDKADIEREVAALRRAGFPE